MPSLARTIKSILHHKSTPEFLFSMYFNWKNAKDKKQLFTALDEKDDLMNMVKPKLHDYWNSRIQNVLDCADNTDIPRSKEAGQIIEEQLVLHNGIRVSPLSYYNYPILKMLMKNKGVHEPQEEKIFHQVLNSLSKKTNKTMLELGAYWSFYSIWFKTVFPDANCYMVEPHRQNLMYGKRNFKLNQMSGTFLHYGIGSEHDEAKNITTVDEICRRQGIAFLDILHSDIQGFELDMLKGAVKMFSENRIGYVFISTHSNDLHRDCKKWIEDKYGFTTVASADLDASYSWDGVLVMKSPTYEGIERVEISHR